jgi:hypothetical protein
VALGALLGIAFTLTCFAQENESVIQGKSGQELRLEHARLGLQLAEIELQMAEQFNRELEISIPSAITGKDREGILYMKRISANSIERLKSNVAIGKTQLELKSFPSTGNPEKLRIRYAEEKVRLAKANLDVAKGDKLRGKQVPELEITRQELKYQMALIDLELLGNTEHLMTVVDSLQRQIDQLREDMIRQDQRITAAEDRQ